jgi:hypothetical protein
MELATTLRAPNYDSYSAIYARALQKCKEVNEQLNSTPWWKVKSRLNASKIGSKASPATPFTGTREWNTLLVQALIGEERKKISIRDESRPEWQQHLTKLADGLINVATQLKPITDIFIPQSPEYAVPYACLWAVFKVRSSDQWLIKLTTSIYGSRN